jgi:hypothetical protein
VRSDSSEVFICVMEMKWGLWWAAHSASLIPLSAGIRSVLRG